MRWFKHLTDSSQNPLLADLEDRFGLEGYARYWKLCEAIAANMEAGGEPKLALPFARWRAILKGKQNKLRSFLVCLANQREINLNQTGNILEIEFPKLKKLRDEWQSRLGSKSVATPEQEAETDVETNVLSLQKKEPKKDPPASDTLFFWIDAAECLESTKQMPGAELGARTRELLQCDVSTALLPGFARGGNWTRATLDSWAKTQEVR